MLTEFPVVPEGRLSIGRHFGGGSVRSTGASAVGTTGTQPSLTGLEMQGPLTGDDREGHDSSGANSLRPGGHDFSRANSGSINPGFSR